MHIYLIFADVGLEYCQKTSLAYHDCTRLIHINRDTWSRHPLSATCREKVSCSSVVVEKIAPNQKGADILQSHNCVIISGLRKRVHHSFTPGSSLSIEDKARGKLVAILIASAANSNSGIFLCSCKYYVVFPWLRQRGEGAVVGTWENFAGRESAIAVAPGKEDDGIFSDGGRLAG